MFDNLSLNKSEDSESTPDQNVSTLNSAQNAPVLESNMDKSNQAKIDTSALEDSSSNDDYSNFNNQKTSFPFKKILIILALVLAIFLLIIIIFVVVKNRQSAEQKMPVITSTIEKEINKPTSSINFILPELNSTSLASTTLASSTLSGLKIEYLTFADFYKPSDYKISPNINNYSLPLNVKIDVMNYYDISRKLNLDPVINNLNSNGFAFIDNPWEPEVSDFYAIYEKLNSNQIPILLTSDLIIYNYQNILKKSFKDIEENVFYKNLWDINKQLYLTAKKRYEAHLARTGDINDPILEGERLEAAYFAVALELLKPLPKQITANNTSANYNLFSKGEANRFNFILPPYLRSDVLNEEKLIRAAHEESSKSPVLLYQRDYTDFLVPSDYNEDPKLNNFYLTTKWLNSVFPINYRNEDCPNCLLDQADWRINLITASLISQDFSLSPDLKNEWARIYKVMSFFKGLQEDLSYVNYRDSLQTLFGNDYQISDIFGEQNKNAMKNMESLRVKLLTYNFPKISGAIDRNSKKFRPQIGFRMLANSYWPNKYIFNKLTAPIVSTYLGTSSSEELISACKSKNRKSLIRCNGLALDAINLIYPITKNDYFSDNTHYLDYKQNVVQIKKEMDFANIWHFNNYWTNLSLMKILLSTKKEYLPSFALSTTWKNREIRTATASWINLQLPLEKFSRVPVFTGTNINNSFHLNQNAYLEPNLNVINELLANNEMLLDMFSALKLNSEVPAASQSISNFSKDLIVLQKIANKELTNQELSANDNEKIIDFSKKFKLFKYSAQNQKLHLNFPESSRGINEDLSHLQLLVLIHQEGKNKVFSVGPVWNYQESR